MQQLFDEIGHAKNLKIIKRPSECAEVKHLKLENKDRLYGGIEIVVIDLKYLAMQILSDYFMESERIMTKNVNRAKSEFAQFSPEIWNKFLAENGNDEYKAKIAMRNSVKQSPGVFPVSIAHYYYSHFLPWESRGRKRYLLDMSSGWGDRLIAAMKFENLHYVGVDPNEAIHPKYAEILKTYPAAKNFSAKMLPYRFEDVPKETLMKESAGKKYDLMFSSPPYFIAEQYFDDVDVYDANVNTWLSKFIEPSIKKIAEVLNPKGAYMIIVINDAWIIDKPQHWTEKIINYARKIPGMNYRGMQKYSHRVSPFRTTTQPVFIFRYER